MQRFALKGLGSCGTYRMNGLGFDPFGVNNLGTPTGSGSGSSGTVGSGGNLTDRDGTTRTNTTQSSDPCPCEVTEITENKTVIVPVKSQKIVCKPETIKSGTWDCDQVRLALNANPSTDTLPASSNQGGNLLGLGDVSMGFSIDFMSLAIGGVAGYLAAKYI